MKHLSQNVRVAIEKDNPAIVRIEDKCIKCGQCARICNAMMSVNNYYDLEKTNDNAVCVHCGQCLKVCPQDAIVGRDDYQQLQKLMKDKNKIFVVSTAPSVRVGLGDEFGYAKGEFVQGKMVALLHALGFNYVLDVNFGADLTICEEAAEFVERLKSNKNLPHFTSCCPAWVRFVEYFYPNHLANLSTCKSPIAMQSAMIKSYFAQAMKIDSGKIVNVAVTPCVAKKAEIKRAELSGTDFVITTAELAKWAKERKIDISKLEDDSFDSLMGKASAAGTIFGNTGGVCEAVLRTAYHNLTGQDSANLQLNLNFVRDYDGFRDAEIVLGDRKIKVCICFGLANARRLMEMIDAGQHFDLVEVMACPGGCIGGAGQPKHLGEEAEYEKERIKSLYKRDKKLKSSAAHTNRDIQKLYKTFLKAPNSELAEKYLHTKFYDRSDEVGGCV